MDGSISLKRDAIAKARRSPQKPSFGQALCRRVLWYLGIFRKSGGGEIEFHVRDNYCHPNQSQVI
jgi:hypothetical protein